MNNGTVVTDYMSRVLLPLSNILMVQYLPAEDGTLTCYAAIDEESWAGEVNEQRKDWNCRRSYWMSYLNMTVWDILCKLIEGAEGN